MARERASMKAPGIGVYLKDGAVVMGVTRSTQAQDKIWGMYPLKARRPKCDGESRRSTTTGSRIASGAAERGPGQQTAKTSSARAAGTDLPSRDTCQIWEAVEYALDEGMTVEQFRREAAQAWEYELRQRAERAMAAWKR